MDGSSSTAIYGAVNYNSTLFAPEAGGGGRGNLCTVILVLDL